jgi:hypothetical protein
MMNPGRCSVDDAGVSLLIAVGWLASMSFYDSGDVLFGGLAALGEPKTVTGTSSRQAGDGCQDGHF